MQHLALHAIYVTVEDLLSIAIYRQVYASLLIFSFGFQLKCRKVVIVAKPEFMLIN